MTRGARQSRNRRRRQRDGLVVLQIEVPEVELLEVLRISGSDSRGRRVSAAVGRRADLPWVGVDRLVVTPQADVP